MKDMLKYLGITIVVIVFIYIIAGVTGFVDLKFYRYFGKEKANIQREIFKENKSYVEGMASDLAKYKYELTTEKDIVARKAIVDLIIDKYANFDINKLEDVSLQNFLRDVRNGKYNN